MKAFGPGYSITLSCHNFEMWRLERLARTLQRAHMDAEEMGDVLGSCLIGIRDHKGILQIDWNEEVFETDNAVSLDLPVVFLMLEKAWREENECLVVHRVGALEIERELTA